MGTRNAGVSGSVPVSLPEGAKSLPAPAPRLAGVLAMHLRALNPAVAIAIVAVAGLALLVALELVLGLLVRDVLGSGTVGRWDEEVSRWVVRQRTPTLTDLSLVGSHLAGIWEVPIGMSIAVGVLFACRKAWWALLMLTAILLEGGQYVSVTFLFSRTRPDVNRLEGLIPTDSFPSGHTAAAVVIYAGFALLVTVGTRKRWLHRVAWVVAAACILFVAASRIYRGMHFLTDTISGALVGVGCLLVALHAVRVGGLVARLQGDHEP